MCDQDPPNDSDQPLSRSQQKRLAQGVRKLAETLASLSPAQLAKLPIPEPLRAHIAQSQAITAKIARKRQLGFLAKQLRREPTESLAAIQMALTVQHARLQHLRTDHHRAERWRDRLLDCGEEALTAFVTQYPTVDRQALRQLHRAACHERAQHRPPHAARRLLNFVRAVVNDAPHRDSLAG